MLTISMGRPGKPSQSWFSPTTESFQGLEPIQLSPIK
jgi:hypothetical protein